MFVLQWLSAEYLFKKINKLGARSIILTSGTLSPLDSIESELGVPFPIKLEGSHVIGIISINKVEFRPKPSNALYFKQRNQ